MSTKRPQHSLATLAFTAAIGMAVFAGCSGSGSAADFGTTSLIDSDSGVSTTSEESAKTTETAKPGQTATEDASTTTESQQTTGSSATAKTSTSQNTSSSDSTSTSSTTSAVASPAMTQNGNTIIVDWDNLASTPFYSPPADVDDPFFHIHTKPAEDGFFLSFELFTQFGQAWTGQTGTFAVSCTSSASTGICPYFDADGTGPQAVKGDDFLTTGSVTIVQLDDSGYEIIVHNLVFSDGTRFEEFTITG